MISKPTIGVPEPSLDTRETGNMNVKQPMTVLAIGDPHFKEGNVEQTREMVKSIVRWVKINQPDLIVCLGDVLDKHAKLHTDPLCEAIDFFEQLIKYAPLVIIIGNHDRRNNSDYQTDRHPFTAMKKWPRCTVVDKTMCQKIKGHLFGYVPYVPPGKFINALDSMEYQEVDNDKLVTDPELKSAYPDIELGMLTKPVVDPIPLLKSYYQQDYDKHCGWMDDLTKHQMAKMIQLQLVTRYIKTVVANDPLSNQESMNISLDSDKTQPDKENVTEMEEEDHSHKWWWDCSTIFVHQEFQGAKMGHIESKIGDSWPTDAPLVISGHIHEYQRVQNNILYTGTPIQHSFGDDPHKSISCMKWDPSHTEGGFESAQRQIGWYEDRVDLGLIKRKTIRLTPNLVPTWVPPEGYMIKLIIEGTTGELKALALVSKLAELKKQGIRVILKTKNKDPLKVKHDPTFRARSYLSALYADINDETILHTKRELMIEWFEEIFGVEKLKYIMSSNNSAESKYNCIVDLLLAYPIQISGLNNAVNQTQSVIVSPATDQHLPCYSISTLSQPTSTQSQPVLTPIHINFAPTSLT